ncbi:Os03g0337550, partial [Oryza sativa Japonica Group]
EQRRRRDAEGDVGAAAVAAEEVVADVDGEPLEQRRPGLALHVGVAQDEGRAGVPRRRQRLQLLRHLLVVRRLRARHVAVDEEPHLLRPPAAAAGAPVVVAAAASSARRRRLHGRRRRVLDAVLDVVAGVAAPDHGEPRPPLLLRFVIAAAAARVAAPVRGVELDEGGEALDELRLERVHVLVHVAVAVAHDAPVGAVARRADAADEVALGGEHVRHRHRLDADEHQHLVERREVGDEAGEVGRHAGGEVGVDEADAGDAHHAELVAEGEQPLQGDLVVQVELVLLDGGVVPHQHDGHEEERQQDGQPRALQELDERRREVERLHGAEEEEEAQRQHRRPAPAQHDHQGRQAGGHQHHCDHSQPC